MEDLIVLGKVISITDDIDNPKLSPFFLDAIVEIHKVFGGRSAILHKDVYDTTIDDKNLERKSVIIVQFHTSCLLGNTEWPEPILFQVDQIGVFALSVFGKKKFLVKNFDQYWSLDEPF